MHVLLAIVPGAIGLATTAAAADGSGAAPAPLPVSLAEANGGALGDLEPLFLKHGVDLYAAGHKHLYESMWPTAHGAATQFNFTDPLAPVHVTSGCGGVPTGDTFNGGAKQPFSRKRINGTEPGFGVLTAMNANVLVFEQRRNNDSAVVDTWTIIKTESA